MHYNNVARQLLGLHNGNSVQYVKVIVRIYLPSVIGNKVANSAVRYNQSTVEHVTSGIIVLI